MLTHEFMSICSLVVWLRGEKLPTQESTETRDKKGRRARLFLFPHAHAQRVPSSYHGQITKEGALLVSQLLVRPPAANSYCSTTWSGFSHAISLISHLHQALFGLIRPLLSHFSWQRVSFPPTLGPGFPSHHKLDRLCHLLRPISGSCS